MFPNSTVLHLLAIQSDHSPILLRTAPMDQGLHRPFKFEIMWTLCPEVEEEVQEAWGRSFTLLSKIKNTKMVLKKWNKEVCGHVQTRIEKIKKDIEELQGKPVNEDEFYLKVSK